MLKNKSLLLIVVFLTAGLSATNSQFKVRELNYQDASEIQQMLELIESECLPTVSWLAPVWPEVWYLLPMTWPMLRRAEDSMENQGCDDYDGEPRIYICTSSSNHTEICGFLTYCFTQEVRAESGHNCAECLCIAAHKDYQVAASLMMEHFEKKCVERKIKLVGIAVQWDNKEALKFYYSLGYRILFVDRAVSWIYGTPCVLMHKKIT